MAQLVFLIVAAMLLIHVAELNFSERNLTQTRVQAGRMLLAAFAEVIRVLPGAGEGKIREACGDQVLRQSLTRLLSGSGFSDAVFVNSRGELCNHGSEKTDPEILVLAKETLNASGVTFRFKGTTWGAIWLSPRDLLVSGSFFSEGRLLGAAAFRAPLAPVYELLRKSQRVIIAYIVLDTLVLTLVGIWLISRIVVKPIHKLLRMTAEYKDGRTISMPADTSTNEIGDLYRSLAVMLKQLEENKRELKAHIASLETANTELQQAQSNLVRSEKLASVGRLAAGIAHEIGNPISISLGFIELLKTGDVTEEERRDFLDRLEIEIGRIHRIIRQLLDFSRPSSVKPQEMHVHDVLQKTLNILKPQPMMQEITISRRSEAVDDLLIADPGRLQQVFINIIMNAADALSESAKCDSPLQEKLLHIRTWNADGNIAVEFTDTGPGIAKEALTHIFDPFFTTKEPGKGTGLGLSVCYRIVESMGGSIRAESPAGKGATFLVTLPLNHG